MPGMLDTFQFNRLPFVMLFAILTNAKCQSLKRIQSCTIVRERIRKDLCLSRRHFACFIRIFQTFYAKQRPVTMHCLLFCLFYFIVNLCSVSFDSQLPSFGGSMDIVVALQISLLSPKNFQCFNQGHRDL